MTGMTTNKDLPTKILTVLNGTTTDRLIDYALTMAFRLDCEIVALDVTEEPKECTGNTLQHEVGKFFEEAQRKSEPFLMRALSMGIVFHHIIKIGNQDEIIRELISQDACIRYVLTKPEHDSPETEQQTRIPIFNLSHSRLQ